MHRTQMSTGKAESYYGHCLSLQPTPSITRFQSLSARSSRALIRRSGRAEQGPSNRRAALRVQNRPVPAAPPWHGVAGARAEPPGAAVQAAVPVPALPPHHAPARALRLLHRPRPPRLPPSPALPLAAQAAALPVPARVRRAQAPPAHPARALLQPRRLRRSGPARVNARTRARAIFVLSLLAWRIFLSRFRVSSHQAMMTRNDRSHLRRL